MATYTVPGVYVSESPLVQNVTRSNTTQSVAAFIGTAPRGPETPTLINSWSAFKNYYDDAEVGHELAYSVYHYFANGGRDAYIVRAVSSSATAASVIMPYYPTGGSPSASLFTATANSRGTWGNTLSLKTTKGAIQPTNTTLPTFNLSILLNNTEVERWNEVSTDPANNRYVESVINNFSKYITLTVASGAKTAASTWAPYDTAAVSLATGASGAAIAAADYQAAADKLATVDGVLVINAPGVTDTATVNYLIAKAEARGNSFVVIDPTSASPDTYGSTVANLYSQSSYAAVYYPMLKMADPSKTGPAAIRDTYPGGAVVGAYIRTEVARTVAKAPAGFTTDVRNAYGLVSKPTAAQAGSLYDTYGVNILKAIPGGGIVINGARTLDKTTPGKYIPIRRTLNYVKQGLQDLSAYAVFEPNDDRLWSTLTSRSSSFLNDLWKSGGLKGKTPAEAFYVICDSTNNTDESVSQGEVRLEVGVALQYPAEFIVISVSQWTGGSNAVSSL